MLGIALSASAECTINTQAAPGTGHGLPLYIRKVEKVNGKLENTVIETLPNVSQFWKYDPEQFMSEPPFGPETAQAAT